MSPVPYKPKNFGDNEARLNMGKSVGAATINGTFRSVKIFDSPEKVPAFPSGSELFKITKMDEGQSTTWGQEPQTSKPILSFENKSSIVLQNQYTRVSEDNRLKSVSPERAPTF